MAEERPAIEGEGKSAGRGLLYKLKAEWIEILATVLLALATIASAWCAYQAARWSSEESLDFNLATAARVHAAEADDLADVELNIDVETFIIYADARRSGDEEKALFVKERLVRDEFRPAVEAWEAAGSLDDPGAPGSPFEVPEYSNRNREESRRLEAEAVVHTEEAKKAIHNSDFYVMLTVLFASVLFFGGICTKFQSHGVKIAVLLMGTLLFASAVTIMTFQPIK